MKRYFLFFILHFILLGFFSVTFISPTNAAQLGKIDEEVVMLYRSPQKNAEVVATLKKGSYIVVSNYPYEGYYKVRTAQGEIGFLPTKSVFIVKDPEIIGKFLRKTKEGQKSVQKQPEQKNHSEYFEDNESQVPAKKDYGGKTSKFRFGLFGGLDFFTWSEFQSTTTIENFKNGVSFGGELYFPMNSKLDFGVRIEMLVKTLNVYDSGGTNTHTLSTSSIPTMVGVGYNLLNETFKINLALFAGVGFNSSLSARAITTDPVSETTYNGIALAGLIKVDVGYSLSKRFVLFSEFGYRYLKTGDLTANPAGTGSSFLLDANSSVVTMVVNHSGIFVGGGIAFYF